MKRGDFEKEELRAWNYVDEYFIDVINGETSLDEVRDNLASFRNTEYYTGTNEQYKTIK